MLAHGDSPSVHGEGPRLNLLSLPSFTAIFFALIAAVIVGAALASLLPRSQVWWPAIVLPVLVLPLRDFLYGPDREAERHDLEPLAESAAPLSAELDRLSKGAGLNTPQLVTSETAPLFAFGTFRRHFVAVSHGASAYLAGQLQGQNEDERARATTLLAHELAHFVNRDVQMALLAQSLLKMTGLFALVAVWSSLAMVALLVKIGPEISRPDFWTALARPFPGLDLSWMPDWFRAQNPWVFVRLAEPARAGETWGYLSLYLANVYLPFALAVPVLYLFFWRKLIRVREFYADARAAQLVGTAETLPAALLLNATLQAMTPAPAGRTARVWMCIRRMVTARFKPGLLALHPQAEEREMALAEPLLVFGSPWKLAVWTGVALLLLELILRNSLTLSYISQPGPYLPLLTSFLVFSTWLLPQTCVGRPARGLLWQIFCLAVVFMVVKISLNILDGGLVLFSLASGRLGALGSVLDVYVRSMLGAGGADMEPVFGTADFNWPQMIDWHIVRPIAFFLFYAAPLLLVTLMVEAWLRQRALTWYVLADRLKRVFVVIVVVLALAQVLVFIPLGERLFFPMFYESWPGLSMAIGLVLLVAAGIAFGLAHRRLSCLCPGCKEHVVEPFTLGKSCPHCGMQLHPWLVAPY